MRDVIIINFYFCFCNYNKLDLCGLCNIPKQKKKQGAFPPIHMHADVIHSKAPPSKKIESSFKSTPLKNSNPSNGQRSQSAYSYFIGPSHNTNLTIYTKYCPLPIVIIYCFPSRPRRKTVSNLLCKLFLLFRPSDLN